MTCSANLCHDLLRFCRIAFHGDLPMRGERERKPGERRRNQP
jgi:hypothetical protein